MVFDRKAYMREYLKKYGKKYYNMKKEKIKEQHKEYEKTLKCRAYRKKYQETHKKDRAKYRKKYHNKTQFAGNRLKALERDKYTCRYCKRTHHEIRLHVHHKDENRQNNKISNLITLCIGCHISLHHQKRRIKK